MSTGTLLQIDSNYAAYVAYTKGEFTKEIAELKALKVEADKRQKLSDQAKEVAAAAAALDVQMAAINKAKADFKVKASKEIEAISQRETAVQAAEKLALAKTKAAEQAEAGADATISNLGKQRASLEADMSQREAKCARREQALAVAEKAVDAEKLRLRDVASKIAQATV